MNREEKLTAILERLKEKGTSIDGGHISAMVITGYLEDLADIGLVESAFAMTPMGKTVRSVCDEFDWKPDDEEIKAFVMEMVEQEERAPFLLMITKWRDDRDGLKEDFKKAQNLGEPPAAFGG